MARKTKPEKRQKTIPYNFGDKHKAYIRKSSVCMINVAEGAVRAGKTVDNVLAFCHELKTTKDKIHLASASTLGNAKIILATATASALSITSVVSADGVSTKATRLLS